MADPTTFAQVAGMVAGLGALGMLVAALNLVALRVVRADEVPAYVQTRIRWWTAHNTAFLVLCAALTVIGLAGLAAA
ncbi:hypothetical protein ACQP2F_19215 [Actinoplanes sp. CA-030573]|uniref:hypothetical protein n=1 Tax=Actinoplanes sp. CA-030573 TaxID=3239898 RepID=UPI003D940373